MMWNFSAILRPDRFLSLGLRTMDFASDDIFLLYGAGFRPFFFQSILDIEAHSLC